jgi:hypothetical protein
MQLTSKVLLALLPFIATSLAQDDKDSSTSAVAPAVSSYLAHLTEKPQYSSVAAIVSTAVTGSKGQSRILNGDLAKVTTRSWYDALPSDVKAYASSVASEKDKLATASGSAGASGAASPSKSGGTTPSGATATGSSATTAPKGSSSAAAASQSSTKNGAADIQARGLMGMGVAGVLGALVL